MSFAIKVTDASSSFFLSNCDNFWVDLKKAVMGLDVVAFWECWLTGFSEQWVRWSRKCVVPRVGKNRL